MNATNILMEEHRVIERVLNTVETAADRLEGGAAVDPSLFIQTTDFVRGFADGCHHKKEEEVLFKALADFGVPVQNGPIGAMLSDHEEGRRYILRMRSAAERLQAGDTSAERELIEAVRNYVGLLRAHIYKEDRILFPLADQVIPLEAQSLVDEGFDHIEHEETGEGVHEKYLALVEKLEAKVHSAAV